MSAQAVVGSARRPAVLADLVATSRVRDFALVGVFAVAIALSAQLAVPVPGSPVPVTGQTFAVLLGAAALGPGRAVAGTSLYLGVGLVGVPWFAVTGSATSGYLLGFVVAAGLVGLAARHRADRTVPRTVLLMVAGNLAIYACGVAGLVAIASLDLQAAIVGGVAPFLVGDAVKVALAAVLLPGTWRLVHRGDEA